MSVLGVEARVIDRGSTPTVPLRRPRHRMVNHFLIEEVTTEGHAAPVYYRRMIRASSSTKRTDWFVVSSFDGTEEDALAHYLRDGKRYALYSEAKAAFDKATERT